MIALIFVYIKQPYFSIFGPNNKVDWNSGTVEHTRSFLFDRIYVLFIINDQLYYEKAV